MVNMQRLYPSFNQPQAAASSRPQHPQVSMCVRDFYLMLMDICETSVIE